MVGLRTHEGLKFEKFFTIVQNEAEKKGFVFFLDCGEDNEFEDDNIQCQNLCGWLIPFDSFEKFNVVFKDNNVSDEWADNLAWIVWLMENNKITIKITN